MPDADLIVLKPLQDLIERIVRSTPIGATEQLAANLTVQAAVWVGKNVMPRTPGLAAFAQELDAERSRQLAKFGDQQHLDGTGAEHYVGMADEARDNVELFVAQHSGPEWALVLLEEVYEALAESDPARLRAELIQVAAVCAAWVSDIDRRPGPTVEDGLPPELLVTASGTPGDGTYKPALCGCGNPTHSSLIECPPDTVWVACTPELLATQPDLCRTALRLPGDGVTVSHFHPQPERP